MKIHVATHNVHKVREISQILAGFEIVPDDPCGAVEDAPDFLGNAFIKVRAVAARHPGEWCMADDSGLEVEALGGAPGVLSARYAGEPSDTAANNALLLKNLDGVRNRRANFTCAIALVDPDGREHSAVGRCFGRIAEEPSGSEGFGYDPLFIPDGFDRSFADLAPEEKNGISHRGRALVEARRILAPGSRAAGLLRLFRVVNLPTVPGDVFAGAAARLASAGAGCASAADLAPVWTASAAGVFLYMFGLADNDIAGAKTDKGRPVPDGQLSLGAARLARLLCMLAALGAALAGHLPVEWTFAATALAAAIILYNRTKWSFLMGLCRGLNVLCGALALAPGASPWTPKGIAFALAAPVLWTLYVWSVTRYSEGEEKDPSRKRIVGLLVGGIVYLQLTFLLATAILFPHVHAITPLLVAGAVMLVALRLVKRIFPQVEAS